MYSLYLGYRNMNEALPIHAARNLQQKAQGSKSLSLHCEATDTGTGSLVAAGGCLCTIAVLAINAKSDERAVSIHILALCMPSASGNAAFCLRLYHYCQPAGSWIAIPTRCMLLGTSRGMQSDMQHVLQMGGNRTRPAAFVRQYCIPLLTNLLAS